MSGYGKVIYDSGKGAERLLDVIGSVGDQHLEMVLDADTREKFEAFTPIGNARSEDTEQEKRSGIARLYKAAGIAAACFLCVVMLFGGMFTQGATEYVPPLDLPKEITVTWGQNQYRSLRDQESIADYGLPEEISEEILGEILTYLCVSGENQYMSFPSQTSFILYACDGNEAIAILYDRGHWIYLVREEE